MVWARGGLRTIPKKETYMATEAGKKKALDIALASILKAHGDGAVMRMGEAADRKSVV